MNFPAALLCAAAALNLQGCATQAGASAQRPAPTWRSIATEDDRRRVREWRTAWTEALRRAASHRAQIAPEGALLNPDAALAQAMPPQGDYRCRTIKIGGQDEGKLHYIAYPAFNCRIAAEEGALTFTKLGGSQRPVGRLFPENDRRLVFLGTLRLADERAPLRYGQDRERNMAGIVERIGNRRWRLVLPYPHFESTLDVIELIPAP